MEFTNNLLETYTFYDILLMKFLFQYFMKHYDTNFPVFRLICKCTFGLKNKNHVQADSSEKCILCNAIETRIFRYLFLL